MIKSKRVSALLKIGILILIVYPVEASVQLHTFFRFSAKTREIPAGRLLVGTDGNFYGTLNDYNDGSVFKISSTGTLIWKFKFNGKNGSEPAAGLVKDAQGYLYGTTTLGGKYMDISVFNYGYGTVFKMDHLGNLIWSSSLDGTNGANPYGGLVRGPNNLLYGTTAYAAFGGGSVFSVNSSGAIEIVHIFNGTDGDFPSGDLVWASDGCLYGCTLDLEADSEYDRGRIFKITPANSFSTLYMFDGRTNSAGDQINGEYPTGPMLELGDSFYGVTGVSFFKIKADGMLTTLHFFPVSGTDILEPNAPLIQAYDGSLYGTALFGGTNRFGIVFKVSTNGAYTPVLSFNGTNGAYPCSGLIKGRDGAFYGTTSGNTSPIFPEPHFLPTIFKLTISRPVLSVAAPHSGAVSRKAAINFVGRTRSRAPVENVYYQLNGNDWTVAITTNAWTNWTSTVTLDPGPNVIRSFAVDITGDSSRTNTTKVFLSSPVR